MAKEHLFYRAPQQKVVAEEGAFRKITSLENQQGFILTSFLKDERFIFEKNGKREKSDFATEIPFCQSKEDYFDVASSFLEELKSNGISKAVFSRIKERPITNSPEQLFEKLCEEYPNAFVYLVSSAHFGTWIGATPEILLKVDGSEGETISLAGTMSVSDTNSWGEKEIEEQRLVTDFIANKLKGINVENLEKLPREELIAGSIKHLATRFKFRTGYDLQEKIISTLHPTPAVSGVPQKVAISLISKWEKHDRSLYAGVIGLISKEKTRLFVNLRCAQLIENKAFLYVGGGFTKDSNIEKEWQETESKAETLSKVFQND